MNFFKVMGFHPLILFEDFVVYFFMKLAMRAPCTWYLCPFYMSPSFLKHSFFFLAP